VSSETKSAAPTAADWIARAASITPRTELFVDGRFVPAASGATFDDIAGRDGSRIAAVAEGGPEDVDRAVAAARRSFDDRRWSDQPPMARKAVLLRLAELVREHTDELALLESLDVGNADPRHAPSRHPERRHDPPVVRRDDRQGVRRGRTDRARRALAGDARTDRSGRRDRALELPDDHHGLEARGRAGDR